MLSKYIKIKALSPLTFLGKTWLLFAIFGLFLAEKSGGSQIKGSCYYAYTLKKQKMSQVLDTEFNAESFGTSFKSQKWKSKKLVCPFLVALFHSETNFENNLSRKIIWFRQKNVSLINLVPSIPSFCTRTKFRLKNRVTITI